MIGGCPCGTHGKCCNNPDVHTEVHEEPDDKTFCEECYHLVCYNCDKGCYCEL